MKKSQPLCNYEIDLYKAIAVVPSKTGKRTFSLFQNLNHAKGNDPTHKKKKFTSRIYLNVTVTYKSDEDV